MDALLLIAADLVAITSLVLGLYVPRHRRRDLVVAFLTVNVGVLAVSIVLGSSAAGLGIGLGLFGVLSIIRLRSSEIEQHEVAYYFASLALGLVAGLGSAAPLVSLGLMALIVAVLALGDSRLLLRRYRQQVVRLDRAYTDEAVLRVELERMLGARVHRVTVRRLDLIDDSTVVEVRYELPREPGGDRIADAVAAAQSRASQVGVR
ncbi:DUF4956 domain-containing protein [Homoserinibacter sp. GY 40078]|uniref:DUF4956 domain-containing protein n=1 Tax=Homoserinibacter sp. GY 40078 TaxID=2603275 RepID=UPI0011CC43D0|nr:DUF4956 domain-containing protein [Homoserinibacter sp. GY 40078]TXK19447.1 DUF4956 domain-containing protein [Homoserinibacter sp. GY 40078]